VQSQKRSVPVPSAQVIAPSNNAAAEPIKIPGLNYAEINFNGSSYSFALIRQLRYWSVTKLVALMAAGYRTQAISILGKEVMSQRGLIGLAIDSLAHCTAEVLAVFCLLADEKSYPVMLHCTQGKDRTGLTILLTLMLLHVDEAAMNADYMRTQEELVSEREARIVEIRSIGMPDSFADCDPQWVSSVCAHVGEKYGSIEQYLLHCGVGTDMQESVKQILLA
jgi:protein-tyrosine phosphatase